MSKLTGHEVRLASRPEGIPAAFNFTLVRTELEPLQDGEVLVRNLFMSVDPYMRGRMNEGQSFGPIRAEQRACERRAGNCGHGGPHHATFSRG